MRLLAGLLDFQGAFFPSLGTGVLGLIPKMLSVLLCIAGARLDVALKVLECVVAPNGKLPI